MGSSFACLPHLELRYSLKALFLENTLQSTKLVVAPLASCHRLMHELGPNWRVTSTGARVLGAQWSHRLPDCRERSLCPVCPVSLPAEHCSSR